MKKYSFHFTFDPIPPNMLRGRHALIVVQDGFGKYVLGRKNIYPEGMARFVGGGIDLGEDPAKGAARELHEELGIAIAPEKLEPLAEIETIIDSQKNHILFMTYLFGAEIGAIEPHPSDDLDGVVRLTVEQMQELIHRFEKLPSDLDVRTEITPFRWSDYGALYGQIHKIGLEMTQRQ